MKIQLRIILIFSLFTILIVLAINSLQYYFVNENSFDDFYKRLEIRAIVAARTRFEEDQLNKNTYEDIRRQHLEILPREQEYFIPVTADGDLVINEELPYDEAFLRQALKTGQSRFRDDDIFYLAHLYADRSDENNVRYFLTVLSAKNEFLNDYLANLRTLILIGAMLTIIVSILFGIIFSKIILHPIRKIGTRMKTISANQLHLRIDDVEDTKDEISALVNSFNDMLNRLEVAFETQKNFISNASHELKTPLTSIIGESEYVLSKDRDVKEYKTALNTVLTQADRLRYLVDSLLHIAQTGFDGKGQAFQIIRMDEVIYNAKVHVDNIIPDNKIQFNPNLLPEDDTMLLVYGNADLLESAIINLLINACKYSDNKVVKLVLAASSSTLIIVIEDIGIGIPKDDMPYIYDPFFRASNTTDIHGYGIGLPLSRNIIRLHKGELHVESIERRGTKIRIELPLYK